MICEERPAKKWDCVLSKLVAGIFSVCFALTFLFGCASMTYPDMNVDPTKNNKVIFQRDAIDCAQSYPESGAGAHVKQRIGCMNLKGWY